MPLRSPPQAAEPAVVTPATTESTPAITTAEKGPKAPKGAKPAKTESGPREGSKTAQVVAMLQRKDGATLEEIMTQMSWQKHTVRGFMAGAMKKAGHTVESFKSEKGERTYRISSIARLPPGPPGMPRRAFCVLAAIPAPGRVSTPLTGSSRCRCPNRREWSCVVANGRVIPPGEVGAAPDDLFDRRCAVTIPYAATPARMASIAVCR